MQTYANHIPIGTYRAVCTKATLGFTSNDSEQVVLDFRIVEEHERVFGRTILWYGYFTEKTTKATIRALRACGWQGDDLTDLSSCVEWNGGKEVELVIEHEDDQEHGMRARVRWVNQPGQGGVKRPMSSDQARQFAARMRSRVVSTTAQMQADGTLPPADLNARADLAANDAAASVNEDPLANMPF